MTDATRIATHTTVTRYRYSGPETHAHCSYREALAFAHARLEVNGVGNVSVAVHRIEEDPRWANGVHDRWIETLGGVR